MLKRQRLTTNRNDERGAALVMVLLISALLLVAVGGLLLEVSLNTRNVTDATAEQQAYNAAESGIQSAINVLRGNTTPSVLIDPSKPATDPVNRITFRKAVATSTSNLSGDASTFARLSRWLDYDFIPSGQSIADRVTLRDPAATYDPRTGFAFSVTLTDPDNTGNIISYNTSGRFYDSRTGTWGNSIIYGSGGDTVTFSYATYSVTNLNVSGGVAATNFGRMIVNVEGAGATIPDDIRFEINVNLTAPYTITRELRGFIKAGTVTVASMDTVRLDFDTQTAVVMGSQIVLDHDPQTLVPESAGGVTPIDGTISQAEPYRVVISSIGYGPRGARKVLEATVQKNFFNGMTAPATLMLVGPSVGAVFEGGSSTNTEYSGDDVASTVIIPPIGTTNDANLDAVLAGLDPGPPHPFNGSVVGTPSNVSAEVPFWLQSPTNLDATLQQLKLTAQASGRYFANGATPTTVGDNATARGITYVEGDLSLSGDGGGILIVTGKLTLQGNFNFNGLILVTGAAGVDRNGGGNGVLQGNIIVAAYDHDDLGAGFLPPKYDLSGGGTSGVIYNSSSVANGMNAVSNFVLAVAEK